MYHLCNINPCYMQSNSRARINLDASCGWQRTSLVVSHVLSGLQFLDEGNSPQMKMQKRWLSWIHSNNNYLYHCCSCEFPNNVPRQLCVMGEQRSHNHQKLHPPWHMDSLSTKGDNRGDCPQFWWAQCHR